MSYVPEPTKRFAIVIWSRETDAHGHQAVALTAPILGWDSTTALPMVPGKQRPIIFRPEHADDMDVDEAWDLTRTDDDEWDEAFDAWVARLR